MGENNPRNFFFLLCSLRWNKKSDEIYTILSRTGNSFLCHGKSLGGWTQKNTLKILEYTKKTYEQWHWIPEVKEKKINRYLLHFILILYIYVFFLFPILLALFPSSAFAWFVGRVVSYLKQIIFYDNKRATIITIKS